MFGGRLRARLSKLSDLGMVSRLPVVTIEPDPSFEIAFTWSATESRAVDLVDVGIGLVVIVQTSRSTE
jgi:hypothetical protein